jgi:hypothetical protein
MRARHRQWAGSGAVLGLALAGCTSLGPRTEPAQPASPPVNLSGYSATFKQGYADGCSSGTGPSRRRDESRYKADTDYMMGWNDGYSICGKKR